MQFDEAVKVCFSKYAFQSMLTSMAVQTEASFGGFGYFPYCASVPQSLR